MNIIHKNCNGLECKIVRSNIDLREENIRLKKQIDLMAKTIDNFDSQFVINYFKDTNDVKQYFEEVAKEKGE